MDLLACGSQRVGRLPKDFASVAAGRTLPTHSCATAPDLNRLPAFGELFSCESLCAVGSARLVEGRHLVQQAHRCANDGQGECCAGTLTEPQVEVQQRTQSQAL